MKAWSSLGSVGLAWSTTAERLSGITTQNTPSENRQAASNPPITAAVVCEKLSHTKHCRENNL